MPELAVTAFGADQPGIVAAVARVLHERGGNVEDSAMTILGGRFAIMLLVACEDEPAALETALDQATAEFDLQVTVARAGGSHASGPPTHLLSVYGADKPGILAGVTAALADVGANITDLETRLLGDDDDAVYAMVIELATDDADRVEAAVARASDDLGVDHTLRPIETATY